MQQKSRSPCSPQACIKSRTVSDSGSFAASARSVAESWTWVSVKPADEGDEGEDVDMRRQ